MGNKSYLIVTHNLINVCMYVYNVYFQKLFFCGTAQRSLHITTYSLIHRLLIINTAIHGGQSPSRLPLQSFITNIYNRIIIIMWPTLFPAGPTRRGWHSTFSSCTTGRNPRLPYRTYCSRFAASFSGIVSSIISKRNFRHSSFSAGPQADGYCSCPRSHRIISTSSGVEFLPIFSATLMIRLSTWIVWFVRAAVPREGLLSRTIDCFLNLKRDYNIIFYTTY